MSAHTRNVFQDFLRGNNGYIFIILGVAILIFAMYYPILYSVYISFTDFSLRADVNYVGFANYLRFLRGGDLWQALANTSLYSLVSVLVSLLLGFVAAIVMNYEIRGRVLYRIIFLLPWVIPRVVVGMTWKWIYDGQFGILNDLLFRLGLIDSYLSWIGSTQLAMGSLIAANIWRSFPFMFLMLLAGLQGIPREQYEAAMVDGADFFQKLWFITLPNLRFIFSIIIVLTLIWSFQDFDLIYVLTRGGPAGATEVLTTLVYRVSFKDFEFGRAASISTIILLILLLMSFIYLKVFKKSIEEV